MLTMMVFSLKVSGIADLQYGYDVGMFMESLRNLRLGGGEQSSEGIMLTVRKKNALVM